MVKEYTLPLGQKLNPQRNPHTMDDQKLFNHMADEHGLLLLESQMREIIDIVLEMHNENPEKCTMDNPQHNPHAMKTAMQEMFEELHANSYYIPIGLLAKCAELMAREKEQIVNAYKEGCSDIILDESTDEVRANEYYNETYTNPDRDENGRI